LTEKGFYTYISSNKAVRGFHSREKLENVYVKLCALLLQKALHLSRFASVHNGVVLARHSLQCHCLSYLPKWRSWMVLFLYL